MFLLRSGPCRRRTQPHVRQANCHKMCRFGLAVQRRLKTVLDQRSWMLWLEDCMTRSSPEAGASQCPSPFFGHFSIGGHACEKWPTSLGHCFHNRRDGALVLLRTAIYGFGDLLGLQVLQARVFHAPRDVAEPQSCTCGSCCFWCDCHKLGLF